MHGALAGGPALALVGEPVLQGPAEDLGGDVGGFEPDEGVVVGQQLEELLAEAQGEGAVQVEGEGREVALEGGQDRGQLQGQD